jgi:hypothetical protein
MINETVYNSRDNTAEWLLLSDGAVVPDLAAVSNMILVVGGVEYDASSLGNLFTWTEQKDYQGELVNVISMQLGKFGIPAGGYGYCRLRVYDQVNTDGVTWSDDITLDVRDT